MGVTGDDILRPFIYCVKSFTRKVSVVFSFAGKSPSRSSLEPQSLGLRVPGRPDGKGVFVWVAHGSRTGSQRGRFSMFLILFDVSP